MTSTFFFLIFLGTIIFGLYVGGVIFRVPVNYLGLPESIFSGRFRKGTRELIHPPYREGLHIKPPWWRVQLINHQVFTRLIERREYQTKTSSVFISGLVEWRYSERALFRVVETEQSIEAGLDALIDDLLSKEAARVTTEECVTRKGDLNKKLRQKLQAQSDMEIEPGVFLSEAEKKYGIEILTVHISLVEPPPELRKARNERQKELYEQSSQAIEREVLLADIESYIKKGVDPDLAAKLALQRQGKLPVSMGDQRIKVDAPDTLSALIAALTKK